MKEHTSTHTQGDHGNTKMDITSFVHHSRDKAFLLGDYSTYRTQLSRQLLSLRRKLGRTTPKNQKFASKAAITAQDVGKSPDFVRLQLLTAERAWAHAMAMKNAHAEGKGEAAVTGSTRKHILSRLQKALRYANELVAVVEQQEESKASDRDVLESTAYARTLWGAYEFEKQVPHRHEDIKEQKEAWKICLVAFSEAHVIYTALLQSTRNEIYKEALAGTIDPSIRYAAYQSRLPRSVAIYTVAKQHFRRSETALVALVQAEDPDALADEKSITKKPNKEGDITDVPITITWRGRVAPISDAAVGQTLAATSTEAAKLQTNFNETLKDPKPYTIKQLAAAYDPALTAAQDTVDAVRRGIADLSKEGLAESDPRMQDLRVTDLAVNYELISWRVGRNRVLISSPPSSSSTSSTSEDGTAQSLNGETYTLDDGMNFSLLPAAPPRRKYTKAKPATSNSTSTTTPPLPPPPAQNASNPTSRKQTQESSPHALSRLQTRTALYDSTLQSLAHLSTLRGAARSPGFPAILEAYTSYFSALRLINIAQSHKLVGNQKEALALFAAARERVGAIDAEVVEGEKQMDGQPPRLEVGMGQLEALKQHVNLLTQRQHGLVALQQIIPPLSSHVPKPAPPTTPTTKDAEPNAQNQQTPAPKPTKTPADPSPTKPLIDDLQTYPASGVVSLTNLVEYPPRIQPVPVKPIFLDLAWNYIRYPGMTRGGLDDDDYDDDDEEIRPRMKGKDGAGVGDGEGAGDAGSGKGKEKEKEKEKEEGTGKRRGWFGFGGR